MDESSIEPPPLRILCFGDSLTAGYHSWGTEYSPYAIRLKQRLEQRFPSREFQIVVDGLPGDAVIDGQYLLRLESRLTNSNSFDWIIMMGGTNDIGWGRSCEAIYEALQEIWTEAIESGAKVLALTVPASRICATQRGMQLIQGLNTAILGHGEEKFWTTDVCTQLPWPNEADEQDRVWDDGLHFTPAGYRMVGDLVADKIIDLLSEEI